MWGRLPARKRVCPSPARCLILEVQRIKYFNPNGRSREQAHLRAGQSRCRNVLFNRITESAPKRMAFSPACPPRTAARCWLDAAPADGRSSPSATRGSGIAGFPKSARILRSKDFRRVYDNGAKFSGPLFSAFCLRNNGEEGVRVGFTCPRALGGAVVRNRIKRRVREVVRVRLDQPGAGWEIVINPRLRALTAPFSQIEREVEKLFQRCAN